jgi:hypothetical protein
MNNPWSIDVSNITNGLRAGVPLASAGVAEPARGTWETLALLMAYGGLACAVMLIWRMIGPGRAMGDQTTSVWRVGLKPWSVEDVALATVGVLAVTLGTSVIVGVLAGWQWLETTGPLVALVAQLMLYAAIGVGFAVAMRRRAITLTAASGIQVDGAGRVLVMGVVFWFAFLPLVGLTMAGVEAIYRLVEVEPHRQDVVEILMGESSVSVRVAIVLFALVGAPVAEEFFFRGFVYPALKQRWGAGWGVLLSSVAFAAMHQHVPTFAPLCVLGVGLALAYEWTGSLLAPVAMHVTFNTGTVALIFLGVEPP